MARPTKESSDKLSEVLPPIRCTKGEKETIEAKSQGLGLSLSEYVREMAINGKIIVKQSDADFATADQLRRLGINLNQQTKRLNATGEVTDDLKKVWQKLDAVLDHMLNRI